MTYRPKPSRPLRTLLLFLGAAVAPSLALLGLFGLEDLGLVAEARLRRDADVRARGIQSAWEAGLSRRDPVASSEAVWTVTREASAAAPGSKGRPSESLPATAPARLHALAARASLAAGDVEAARQHVDSVEGKAVGAELLISVAQGVRLLGDAGEDVAEATQLYGEVSTQQSFDATYRGTSARLLALLCVERWLPPAQRAREVDALRDAAVAGTVTLPSCAGDTVEWIGDSPTLVDDERWSALETVARGRMPAADSTWDALFQRSKRCGAALARTWPRAWFDAASEQRWTLHHVRDAGPWAAIRGTEETGWQVAIHSATALDQALAGALEGPKGEGPAEVSGNGFLVQCFAIHGDSGSRSYPGPTTPSLAGPLPLAGVSARLHLTHRDPAEYTAPLTRRFQALRLGLLLTATLIAAASALAWAALVRSARLAALRSTFVASVSHDLRTPVATIGLLAENMAHGYHAGAEGEYVASLRGQSTRLGRLIDDLLDFGRIERGLPPEVRREPVMVAQWLQGFHSRERLRCHELGCALDLVIDSLPESARLDVHALERALGNLIDNAIKHGKAKSIEIHATGRDEDLLLEVIDSGTGLTPSAIRADLFRPFERGGAETAGTGLGLGIVRAIAEAHGGSATLGPRPGAGAVARVTVRLDEEATA
ncbi:MAG: HAMP domain-containing sensor histidine kinase [Planctomycetota bacterium]